MLILSIETSCDETSVSILEGNEKSQTVKILSNIVSSQVKLHAKWGGVVPNLAAREHVRNIVPVLDKAIKASNVSKDVGRLRLSDIDLFATTVGPGLIPALLVGTNVAKTLAYYYQKPLIGIHHIEAHMVAALGSVKSKFKIPNAKCYPILSLIVSGGHTQLILSKKPFEYEIIGQTQDDAVGEAFDKVAKILDLGYPGGPIVSRYADDFMKIKNYKLKITNWGVEFPRPMIDSGDFNFSFSGLKTAVLYKWQSFTKTKNYKLQTTNLSYKRAVCHAFQEAVVDVLTTKTLKAIKKYEPKTVILAGGVAANKALRKELEKAIKEEDKSISYLLPLLELCGDNAAMVGAAAFLRYLKYKKNGQLAELKQNWKTLEADANLELK